MDSFDDTATLCEYIREKTYIPDTQQIMSIIASAIKDQSCGMLFALFKSVSPLKWQRMVKLLMNLFWDIKFGQKLSVSKESYEDFICNCHVSFASEFSTETGGKTNSHVFVPVIERVDEGKRIFP